MRITVQMVVACVLAGEAVFIISFMWGGHGYHAVTLVRQEEEVVVRSMHELDSAIEKVRTDIAQLGADPYAYECIAREQLHMMYPQESIFVYKST